MSKTYYLKFGSGDPRTNTGLTPTFVIFSSFGVTALQAPGVTETPASSGLYQFTYGPTGPIVFLADGGSALSAGDRYISATLDPIQAVDEKVGYNTDSFGSTGVDPTTIMGFVKRNLEFNEGDAVFTKATGIWDIYSRGSSTLLREKTLTNDTTSADKV